MGRINEWIESGRLHEDADALSRFPVRGTEEEEEKEVMLPVWLISEQPGTQQALRLEQEAEAGWGPIRDDRDGTAL